MACCIVVGPFCKEKAVYLLPAALRDFVNWAYVVQVRTPLQNFDGQAQWIGTKNVHLTTVFYWSAWPGVEYDIPRAASEQSPHVIMWSHGQVRGVDARGLQGSVENKDTDTGTQACVLRLCNCVFCFPPKGAALITVRAALDYLSMELCKDVLRAIAHQADITTRRMMRRSRQARDEWEFLLSNVGPLEVEPCDTLPPC